MLLADDQAKIDTFIKSLEKLDMLHVFTSALRSMYVAFEPSGNSKVVGELKTLRDNLKNDGEVYITKVLPVVKSLMGQIRDYFNSYKILSYDEWTQCIKDLQNEASGYGKVAQVTVKINQRLEAGLATKEKTAQAILAQMKDLVATYEKEEKKLEAEGKLKDKWALALSFLPGISAIASPILRASGDSDLIDERVDCLEAKVDGAGALLVANTIIPAMQIFIKTLVETSNYFQTILADLKKYSTGTDKTRKFYYALMQNNTPKIMAPISKFFYTLTDLVTDLNVIPKEGADADWINKWGETEKKMIWSSVPKDIAQQLVKQIEEFVPNVLLPEPEPEADCSCQD